MASRKFATSHLSDIFRRYFLALCIGCACATISHTAQGIELTPALLPSDQAFTVRARVEAGQSAPVLRLDFAVVKGHYLYRHKIALIAEGQSYSIGDYLLPAGNAIYDEFFGDVQVYESDWSALASIALKGEIKDVKRVEVALQGCSRKPAVCYPPERRSIDILPLSQSVSQSDLYLSDPLDSNATARGAPTFYEQYTRPNSLSNYLATSPVWLILPLFWFMGLLLSLTPCILPMIPILGGMLVSESQSSKRWLAFLYVMGMSLAYSSAGIAAALVGNSLQGFLQRPAVLLSMSGLLVILALSMFDRLNLQAPMFWRDMIARWQKRFSGAKGGQAFVLGALSAWVISPCVTPPLVGALIYIANSGDVYLGGTALMALGIGMGSPLLLMGYAAHLLPSSGAWMVHLKHAFGVLILVSAAFLASRALVDTRPNTSSVPASEFSQHNAALVFESVDNVAAMKRVLGGHEGLLIHKLYADWCSSCLRMERDTFADERVQAALNQPHMRLLVSDVTAHSPQDRALMREYGLFGPPTLMFFVDGSEIEHARMVGYVDADSMLRAINNLLAAR